MNRTKCRICGEEKTHVHKYKVLTDQFIPTQDNPICHCGKVCEHIHTEHQIILFHNKSSKTFKAK